MSSYKIYTVTAILTAFALLAAGCAKALVPDPSEVSTEAPEEEGTESGTAQTESGKPEGQKPEKAEVSRLAEVITHPVVSREKGGEAAATGEYPEIVLTPEGKKAYPKLEGVLSSMNDDWKTEITDAVINYGEYKMDDDSLPGEFSSEVTAKIVRFDERMLSIDLFYYDFSGGAHPNHSEAYVNLDPVSGRKIELADVIADTDNAPRLIGEAVYNTYPDMVEEIESYNYVGDSDGEGGTDLFARKFDEGTYAWTLDGKGLSIVFSPYEIASYAAGYLDITLPYDKYPDLIQKAYIPEDDTDITQIVSESEAAAEEIELISPVTLPNKTWEGFYDESLENPDAKHVTLKKLTEEKSDWLDTERWADANGFDLARLPYGDGEHYYEPANPVQYNYMYNEIRIYDKDYSVLQYDLDIYTLINGPDEKTGKTVTETGYIKWAQMYRDVLYISCGHNTYSSSEPDTSYIIAIDPKAGTVLWRSRPLVSNAFNFKIVGETIICGYGFTAEDDFIYTLDLYTGKIIDRIKVNSGPDQFEVVGDTLYVATYNTAYTFAIEN